MKNEPKKVYLQIGDVWDGTDPELDDFKELAEVTWCADRIWPNDLEYVSVNTIREWMDEYLSWEYRDSLEKLLDSP